MRNRIIQLSRALFRRKQNERELDSEIQFHLDREVEDNLKTGMTLKQATREARQSLGGPTQVKEAARDVRPGALLETIFQDVRFGLRSLRKNPGFTGVVVLILALGIGANVGIFSISNSFFLKPLPFPDPDQLMRLYGANGNLNSFGVFSYPNYRDLRDRNQVFEHLAVHRRVDSTIEVGEEPISMQSELVSGNYFQMLGIPPLLGRTLTPDDDQTLGGHPVVVISRRVWRNIFNEAPNAIGEILKINAHDYTIVGVMPESFRGSFPAFELDLWLPIAMYDQVRSVGVSYEQRGWGWLQGTGRLMEGVTVEQAQSEMMRLSAQLVEEFPQNNQGMSFPVVPARFLPDAMRPALTAIITFTTVVAALVLFLTCANIASILLARTMSRRQEIAIRQSLGATWGRLIRQLFTETMLLALMGMALGLVVAIWTEHLIYALLPSLSFLENFAPESQLDFRVFLFALGVALLTGFALSLLTTMRLGLGSSYQAIRDNSAQATPNPGRSRLQGTLVIGQVGLSFVLLIAAGLLLRTLNAAANFDIGFNTDNMLVSYLRLDPKVYDEARGREFHEQLADRLRALPGVQAVSRAIVVPLSGSSDSTGVQIEGYESTTNQGIVSISFNTVSTGYFEMMGIPQLLGREFTTQDTQTGALPVVVVNETLSKQYWSDENPIGKTIILGGANITCTVIGIVADINYNALGEEPRPFMYFCLGQNYSPGSTIQLRTAGASTSLMAAVKHEVRELDPSLKLAKISTMNEYRQAQLLPQQFLATVSAIFATLAVLLTSIGLYGTISYLASQRTHEIGIRMALGSPRSQIARLIVSRGLMLTIVGGLLGLIAAFFLTRFMESWLFDITPTDPMTFIGVSLLMMLVAVLASFLPALRAMKVDPMTALHCE